MNRKRIYLYVLSLVLMSFITLNTYAKNEDFNTFIKHFVTSAEFQYSRVKFPLKSPIVIVSDSLQKEILVPFTKDKWPLIDSTVIVEDRVEELEGGVFVSEYIVNEPDKKVFRAGYEESEFELYLVFNLIDQKWYVVDCYTAWFAFLSSLEELNEVLKELRSENALYVECFP